MSFDVVVDVSMLILISKSDRYRCTISISDIYVRYRHPISMSVVDIDFDIVNIHTLGVYIDADVSDVDAVADVCMDECRCSG